MVFQIAHWVKLLRPPNKIVQETAKCAISMHPVLSLPLPLYPGPPRLISSHSDLSRFYSIRPFLSRCTSIYLVLNQCI